MVTPTAAGARPALDRRFDRSSWLTLGAVLALLTLGLLITGAAYRVPADGWLVDKGDSVRYENPVYLVALPGVNPGLQRGDVLLAVDGVRFEVLENRAATLRSRRPDNWVFGATVHYTLRREGREIVVPVRLRRPPLALIYRPVVLRASLEQLTTLVNLLLAGILFVLRPRQRAAQLFFLFATAVFVDELTTWGGGVPAGVADLFSPATYWPRIIPSIMLWTAVILPVLVHFFLIFPVPAAVIGRRPLIPVLYGLSAAVGLLYVWLSSGGFEVAGQVLGFSLASCYALIIAGRLLYNLVTVRDPVPRLQMRWIAFGGLIGIVGYLAVSFAANLAGDPLPDKPWTSLFNLLLSSVFPLSLAVAVLRYRLWDIEVIINRSLVYGSLTAALGLIYFGSVVLLQALFRALTGQGSPVAVALSTLVIAGLFSPLRRHVQRFIDRRLYRRKYDAALLLGRFAATVRDEPDLDRLTAELLHVVGWAMQAEHVSVWLRR